MKGLGSPLRDVRTASLVVGLVAAVVFANSLANEFAFDDVLIVERNPVVQELDSLTSVFDHPYWPGGGGREQRIWRPLTTATLTLLHAAGDGEAAVFHAMNTLGHAATSILALLLMAALMPLPAALVGGLVFAVHPLHVDAVANVVGIAEVLSAAAVLAACLVHLRGPARSGWPRSIAIAALYFVAFGTKESGVTLPALIFLIDAARRRIAFRDLAGYVRDRWRVYLAMALVAAALLARRQDVLGGIANPEGPLGAQLLTDVPRIWTLGEVWTHYVRLWVFPLDLAADYSPNIVPVSLEWHAANVAGVLVALTILLATWITWRREDMRPDRLTSRAAAFGVVWFIIAVSTVSNVIFLSGVLLAERTLYLPSVGLAAATGWLIVRLHRVRPRLALATVGLVLVLASVRTWTRTPTWRDNQTMFNTLLRDYPQSGRAQWIIADEYFNVRSRQQALLSFRVAANVLDSHYTLLTHIALKLLETGDPGGAERMLTLAWHMHPEIATAPRLVTWLRAEAGDPAGTELWARRSIELYEADRERHHLLVWALAAQGRWDEARAADVRAQELGQPGLWPHWVYLAWLRQAEGDSATAVAMLDSAWAKAMPELGRGALDSIRVVDFGLPSRAEEAGEAATTLP